MEPKENKSRGGGRKVTEQAAQGSLLKKVRFEPRLNMSKLDM